MVQASHIHSAKTKPVKISSEGISVKFCTIKKSLLYSSYFCKHCQVPWREATNLAVRVLGWWGVASTSVPLRNAIKAVVCV